MSLKSDLVLPRDKFSEDAVTDASKKFNQQLIDVMEGIPKWYEVVISVLFRKACAEPDCR